ncbi:LLM class flavin-dependent oxidoreductase [Sphingosinicella soli]|uniref:Alkanesulfonate monooxygenase SsuD/methylene tetrahydromethanopterin reductase-like flavin-dependent oxidoreductase (Luciferase family) n=1 Tax=Sphingosinicella soli TaxID=333708 RepID=A0A7W7B3V1_9SPHN|nr:LLM class flavin-dependent oxidoreductase [Sphingosinicella soli]MBB4632565.1 alkanesulfonate monooxygenase SsuD/methylene tetrahydromethanopterin reductase-like flavin-dependent oxidoreductase (luciferase family) [Sphingosinicella soli]
MRVDLLYALTNRSGQMSWHEVLEAARRHAIMADKIGFDGIWLGEHHFDADGVDACANPIMLATDLAARTERIRLGLAAVQLPLWHPVRLAEDLSMLDHFSGGRLEPAFARGIVDFEVMNINPAADRWSKGPETSEAIFEENFQALKAAMTMKSFNFKGERYTFPYPNQKYKHGFGAIENHNPVDHGCNTPDENGILSGLGIVPQPLQKPTPPMYVVTESMGGFMGAARRDIGAITWYPTGKGLKELFETYRNEVKTLHNRELALGERCAVLRLAFVAKTDAEARKVTEDAIDGFAKFVNYVRRANMWLDVDEDQNDPRFKEIPMFDLLMERDHLMIGSPDSVIERMTRLSRTHNVKHWLLQMGFPGIRNADLESSLELFGKEVLPALKSF